MEVFISPKVVTLSQLLAWSHFVELLSIENELKRDFYVTMCKNEKERCVNERKMSLDRFYRDSYMLNFLGLKDTYSEKDLEDTILAENPTITQTQLMEEMNLTRKQVQKI